MPAIDLLFDELTQLKIMRNNRVDHPRKASKDLADAVCGAIFGAISHTPRNSRRGRLRFTHLGIDRGVHEDLPENVINYKPTEVPEDVLDYLEQFKAI
jgi:hypothetical protein